MMPESNVAMQIRTVLARRLKRDVSGVRTRDSLREDLDLDSLDLIELMFKIEEALDVDIPNEDLSKIKTVGDVIVYAEARLDSKAPRKRTVRPAAKKR
jgi:acyl carrier protein